MKILMIDNFDSFTYNLVDEFRVLGCEVLIYRNDIGMEQLDEVLESYEPQLVTLSPGPSAPKQAGICLELVKTYHAEFPILGICLGHQILIEAFGGEVAVSPQPVHGKKSAVTHSGTALFHSLPSPFSAGRYHSLYGARIPEEFLVTAEVDGVPMAVESRNNRLFGLQFHPESILTTYGRVIMKNILEMVK